MPYPTSVSEPEDSNMKHDHEKTKPYPTSVSEPEYNNMKPYYEKKIRHPTSVSEPEDNNALKGSKSMNTSRPETEWTQNVTIRQWHRKQQLEHPPRVKYILFKNKNSGNPPVIPAGAQQLDGVGCTLDI